MKSQKIILTLTLWIAAIALPFFLGGKFYPHDMDSKQGRQELRILSENNSNKSSVSSYPTEPSNGLIIGAADAFKEGVRRALFQSDMAEKQIMLFRAFEGLNHDNLGGAIAAIEELPEGMGKSVASMILMRSWADFDPEGAISYSLNELGPQAGKISANEAMRAWAARDPSSAVLWIQSNFDSDQSNPLLSGLMLGWGAKNLGEATSFAQSISDTKLRDRSIGQIANQALAHGPDAMKTWVDSLEDLHYKEIAMSMIAKQWGVLSPTQVASWLESHASEDYASGAIENLADRWSRNNPAGVAEWLSTLPDGESKEAGTVDLLNCWIESDPVSAGEFLNNQPPGPGLDRAIDRYARDSAEDDPAVAITWADSLFDPEMRRSSVIDVARKWVLLDPQAAESWMLEQQLPADMQEAIQSPSEAKQEELKKWLKRRSSEVLANKN